MTAPKCRLALKVTPGAPRDEIIGEAGDTLRLKLRAPPVDGRANDALLRFLAQELDLPTGALRIASGATSRRKLVEITGLALTEVRRRLLSPST